MAQVTFGMVLREARERKGYDLASAARRLRIRPDILRAIEESDFARMPPRGYTRNMVNAYARLVGLNPTEMTRMYLDEAYAYQVGRARSDAQPTGFDRGATTRTARSGRRSGAQQHDEAPPRQNAFGRTMYDDRRDYGTRAGASGRLYSEGRMHPSRHVALPDNQFTNFYAGPKAPSAMQSKLPFIIAGAVILILLIVVLALLLGNKGDAASEEGPKVPISGLTDPTQSEGSGEGDTQEPQQTAPVVVAPTKAIFEFEVADGKKAYIEVYENGGDTPSIAEDVSGPTKKTYEVTSEGKLKFVTTNPEAVTITVDGEAVEAKDSDDGVYVYTVDFAAILEQWKADHPEAGAASVANTDKDKDAGATDGAGTSTE